MTYRRPAVTVIQEYIGLVPALAAFNLPTVVVGPAYQLVNSDLLGTYSSNAQSYAYASLMGGAQVDLEETAVDEQFPATKKQISVEIKSAEVRIVNAASTGDGSDVIFNDATLSKFANVLAGDSVVIVPALAQSIILPQADGASVATAGLRDRLTAGTPGQFANVKVGDSVAVTGGTNAIPGTVTVLVKISSSLLKLSADINDGVGASSDTAYSITGDRGVANAGAYVVKTKISDNSLELQGPLAEAEYPISYYVKRKVASISVARALLNGFSATASDISIPSNLTVDIGLNSFPVIAGNVYASYRGLRNDLAANVMEFGRLSDVQAFFGLDQITPQNPLAFGLNIKLQNTITPVNALGLDGSAVSDESLSYLNALDVLGLTDMYCIQSLTQNPVIPQLIKTHVEGYSAPDKKKERVGIVNRLLKTEEIIQTQSTLDTATLGSRVIASTQLDGAGVLAFPATLNDLTVDAFLNVQKGDTVVITNGTNATVGEYEVLAKVSNNALTLDAAAFTGTSTDTEYYIVRKDGLGADGVTYYDRNANFISDGVAPGHYVRVLSGPLAGSYRISNVVSNKQVLLDQVLGVTSLQTGLEYEVFRNLSKTEQAQFISGYSASLASRRMVVVWPDVAMTPVGQSIVPLPGFYQSCAIGAMTTGLPTQQGFTNLLVSGFLGLQHSTGYFTDEQLDIIADGGTMIFGQAGAEQPLFVRHQLTTDRSSIKFQEYSVTKNVDFIAKFIRRTYGRFIGPYNIIDTTLDEIRGTATGVIKFLKEDTILPRIGGVIRSGTLSKLEESETQIDTVKMRFKFDIPIPLNNLDITIEV